MKSCQSRLFQAAQQIQRKAVEGKLGAQEGSQKQPVVEEGNRGERGYENEYYEREDDIHRPLDSGDEGQSGRRRSSGLLVGPETDSEKFEWKVGQRFANREDFKKVVAKYAIMQKRNVYLQVSNKNRKLELGVRRVQGFPILSLLLLPFTQI